VGWNFSAVAGDDAGTTDTRTTLAGGIYGARNLGKEFSLRLEALIFPAGGAQTFFAGDLFPNVPSDPDAVYTLKMNYITFPLLFVWKVKAHEKGGIRFYAGPYFSIRTKAEVTTQIGGVNQQQSVKDQTNSTDYGGVLAAAGAWDTGQGEFSIQLRYTFGLTSLAKDGDLKNNVVSLFFTWGPWGS